jgi:rhodanese-related sulfurtransferase
MTLDSTSPATPAKPEAEVVETIEEITVEEFNQRINQPNEILLVDVRNEDEIESWKIESRFTPETMHIPYTIFADSGPPLY